MRKRECGRRVAHPGAPGSTIDNRLIAVAVLLLLSTAGCRTTAPRPQHVFFPAPPSPPHAVHLISFNSLDDLVPRRMSLHDVLLGLAPGPYCQTPSGVAWHGDTLYLCDTGRNVVHAWNLRTGEARRVGASGPGTLAKPVAVAVNEAGQVYVADTERGEVVAFDAHGAYGSSLRPEDAEAPFRPVGLAWHSGELYVADVAAHRVHVFDADGAWTRTLGDSSDGESFYFPMAVTVDADGRALVADMMNARVVAFAADGSVVASIGQPGDRYGDLGKPRGLAVWSSPRGSAAAATGSQDTPADSTPAGIVFIADSEFRYVHLFDAAGQLLMLLGGPRDEPGGTPMPAGATVATALPPALAALSPEDFDVYCYLFVTNTYGAKRVSLFAIGAPAQARSTSE